MKYKITISAIRALIKATNGNVPTWAIALIASHLGVEADKLTSFIGRLSTLSDSVLGTVEEIINFKWTFGAAGPGHLTGGAGEDCPDCVELNGFEDIVFALKTESQRDGEEIDLALAA